MCIYAFCMALLMSVVELSVSYQNCAVIAVKFRYFKVEVHPKLLIFESKLPGPRKFTLSYQ